MRSLSTVEKRGIVALMLTFVGLATIYNLSVPLFEAPDEVGHYYYILHLRTNWQMPHQIKSNSGEAHQPPLYYLLAAIATLPADLSDSSGAFQKNPNFGGGGNPAGPINVGLHGPGESFPYQGQAQALHLARSASTVMGAVTILLILFLGWEVFPNHPWVGWLAASLTAFNPQFLFLSGVINNDNLLITITTLGWLVAMKAIRDPAKELTWVALGVLSGLTMLTKINGAALALASFLILLYKAWNSRSFLLLRMGLTRLLVPMILLTGWWFAFNQINYGDPLGLSVYAQIYAANQRAMPFTLQELIPITKTQFHSFWGIFGWMNLWAPLWYFNAIKIGLFLGLIGLGLFGLKLIFSHLAGGKLSTLFVLVLVILVQLGMTYGLILGCNESCYQGRYLFPALGPLMILLAAGLLIHLPARIQRSVAIGLASGMFILAVYMPFFVIQPAYRISQVGFISNQDLSIQFIKNMLVDSHSSSHKIQGLTIINPGRPIPQIPGKNQRPL